MSTQLRHVKLDTGHTLLLWQAERQIYTSKTTLGYSFCLPGGTQLFRAEDFHVPQTKSVDSDEVLRGLLSFLTLRPGDTDAEYFKDYNQGQRAFAEGDAEELQWLYSEDGPGKFEDLEI